MTQTQTDPIEAAVVAVEKRVDELRGRLAPSVRELVIKDDIAAVEAKYKIEDIPALDPAFVAKLRAKKAADYDAETKALDQSIAESLVALEENIVSEIARRRRLPSESERINPHANHASWVQAKLLDTIAGKDAREWLDANANNQAAILERLASADDREDGAFVREAERRFGFADNDPNVAGSEAEAKARMLSASPLTKAIRARQDARAGKPLTEQYERVQKVRAAHALAKAERAGDTLGMTGAILRRAAK